MELSGQKGHSFAVLLSGLLILVVLTGVFYYQSRQKHSALDPQVSFSPIPSPNSVTENRRIVINGEYYFDITAPLGYTLEEVAGDESLTRSVLNVYDQTGQQIINIYTYAAGERTPVGKMLIDGVPFTINYYNEIKCGADIDASNWVPGTQPLFNIRLSCKNPTDRQMEEYTMIIESIRLSPELKKVLRGRATSKF